MMRVVILVCLCVAPLTVAMIARRQVHVEVQTTVTSDGYKYAYTVKGEEGLRVASVSVAALGPVTDVTAPLGWVATTTVVGSQSVVQWLLRSSSDLGSGDIAR